MYSLALFIGIYSYGIFALGVLDILSRINIIGFTISWTIIFIFYHHDKLKFSLPRLDIYSKIIITLISLQLLVNLIGALGPELGFDALWYHLSLPKIWLMRNGIDFLPGPVLRYSVMPKLTETLYTAGLSLMGPISTKLIHYLFALLSLGVTYQIARKFLTQNYSLVAVLILSQNLIFGWESTSAYVDLARTFFEVLALKLFIEQKYTYSAITLGLAITTKVVSVFSLPIFLILLLLAKPDHIYRRIFLFSLISLLIPSPWFLFSFITTQNPLYPIFSPMLESLPFSFNPIDVWNLFTASADPITPLYVISAPLIFFVKFTKQSRGVREIFLYAGISLLIWFITPRGGGSRFILPYLPAFSVITALLIRNISDRLIRSVLIGVCVFLSLISIAYRFGANQKYLPVVLGQETANQFLSANLDFTFGDFADTDYFLTQTVDPHKQVLVAGINNLFYLPPNLTFTHISELSDPKDINQFDYFLLRPSDSELRPDVSWSLLHFNPTTNTQVFIKH